MYKATVTPTINQIPIPAFYIGKKIEIIVYTVDEISNDIEPTELITKKNPSDYSGSLSKEAANQILFDIKQSRNEWNRVI